MIGGGCVSPHDCIIVDRCTEVPEIERHGKVSSSIACVYRIIRVGDTIVIPRG